MATLTGVVSMGRRSVDSPEEIYKFDKSKPELAIFKNGTIGRITLEPEWSWDQYVKPIVNTNSYEARYTQYVISGRIQDVVGDGSEQEFGPGDTAIILPGYNTWVIGNETVVDIDFTGLKDYPKEEAHKRMLSKKEEE
jgi:hypothetical protein